MDTCWFYDDNATRSKGRVVSRFDWKGTDHVVIDHAGRLLVRESCVVSEDADLPLGFGEIEDDLFADIGEIVQR